MSEATAAPAAVEQPQGQPAAAPAPVATAIPASAPAAAPAAALAPAPAALPDKQEPAKVDDGKGQFGAKITYNKTGSEHLDLAVGYLGNLGLNIETLPGYAQAAEGDFSILKAHLSTLNIPGVDAYVALAEQGLKTLNDQAAAVKAETQRLVVEAAGDEATWEAALDFVRANTEDDEGMKQRDELNAALSKGGLMAKLAADFIVQQYQAQSGTTVPQRKTAVGEHAAAAPAGGAYVLSAQEYQQAVEKLRRENPGQELEGSDQLNALRARRQAGMRAGR